MKRHYASIIEHGDGTYSGGETIGIIERLSIFKDSTFTISGYCAVNQYELIELMFCNYAVDGIVARRVFHGCTFSFVDFTRREIDDIMFMLGRRKKPSQVRYSFIHCKVLSDGKELTDCFLRNDEETTMILNEMPEKVKTTATQIGVQVAYNLKEMTIFCDLDAPTFSEQHQERMKRRRVEHALLKKKRQEARAVSRVRGSTK